MKILTLISLLTLTSLFSIAQNCHRTGTFVGAGDVDVKGSVTLEVQADGSINLVLSSDFISDAGPDLDIYIGQTMRVDGFSIRLQALGSLSGTQTYSLPAAIKLGDYSYITIHCTQYNHYYGAALLGVNAGNCGTVSVNDVSDAPGLNVDVNSSEISLDSDRVYNNVSVELYDFSGTLVMKTVILQVSKGNMKLVGTFPKAGIILLLGENWSLNKKYIIK